MYIGGFQKLSLLDFPGKVACTLFTSGCNFRCPFCHNAPLVVGTESLPFVPEEDFLSFLKKRRDVLDGVCISGGEPTLQNDLLAFIERIKLMDFSVKLDTNGSKPEVLKEAVNQGLIDYVAMDIKNSPQKYGETAGANNLDFYCIRESVSFLMSGKVDFEFRTTLVRELHTVSDMEKIGKWLCGFEKYFLQPYKDSENVIAKGFTPHTKDELERLLEAVLKYIPNTRLRSV